MKLSKLRIENFRSFKNETIYFDDYTCLVGANGTGKSAVLTALNVFFRNNASTATNVLTLSEEDFHHKSTGKPVKITLTFVIFQKKQKKISNTTSVTVNLQYLQKLSGTMKTRVQKSSSMVLAS